MSKTKQQMLVGRLALAINDLWRKAANGKGGWTLDTCETMQLHMTQKFSRITGIDM